MIKNCENCGKEFTPKSGREKTQKYDVRSCSWKAYEKRNKKKYGITNNNSRAVFLAMKRIGAEIQPPIFKPDKVYRPYKKVCLNCKERYLTNVKRQKYCCKPICIATRKGLSI